MCDVIRGVLVGLMLLAATVAVAAGYNSVSPETLRQWQEARKKMLIIDIQVPADFAKRHLKSSIETNAFPVKTEQERQRLEKALEKVNSTKEDVVIVCPRGGGGARNTYDYFREKGVDEKRLFILEKGMEGWPYAEMCATGR